MQRLLWIALISAGIGLSLWVGFPLWDRTEPVAPTPSSALSPRKPFVLFIYAHNDAPWCEEHLKALLEQEYTSYRILLIDDGSTDHTWNQARLFLQKKYPQAQCLRQAIKQGFAASLYRAALECKEQEILVPMTLKSPLVHPKGLQRLNALHQDPNLWLTFSPSSESLISCYASLFQELGIDPFLQDDPLEDSYLSLLCRLCGKKKKALEEPCFALTGKSASLSSALFYKTLQELPDKRGVPVDLLVFSYNRPMQLYACLESLVQHVEGVEETFVLYRAEGQRFRRAYLELQKAFPRVHFIEQSSRAKKDFKKHLLRILSRMSSSYLAFVVDDILVKEPFSLKEVSLWMEKTQAYGFYLRLGEHIHHCYQSGKKQKLPQSHLLLPQEIRAWNLCEASEDFGFPNNLDFTVYRKSMLLHPLKVMKYNNPTSLESLWAKQFWPERAIGLCYRSSKIVNVPLNVTGPTGNPHMNAFSSEELLERFEQGKKIDFRSLYQVENASPHFEWDPEFITR